MRDADDEIREIKTEIIESRGLIIKTNNLTNSLAADIKSIAKRQASYERRFNWNSAVAYVLFATLWSVGLKLWSDVRINEIESEKEELQREVAQLGRDLGEATRRTQQREQAEVKAAEYYEWIRQKEYTKVVEGYEEIRTQQLSPAEDKFFQDTENRFRLELALRAYQNGLSLIRTGRYAEAADSFEESLRLKEETGITPAVRYQLAAALFKLGRPAEAASLAKWVYEQNQDKELQDDAAWLLSDCAAAMDNIDEARNMMRTLMRRFPRSALLPEARKRLGELNAKVWKSGK